MTRFTRRRVYAALVAILLGGGGLAHAVQAAEPASAAKIRCEVTQAGKKEMRTVATREACTKLGGKVVQK